MNFSNEEVYSMYGQYDRLVQVDFHIDSEAYVTYGASLMGTFKYIQEERNNIINLLKQDAIPRTEKRILFIPLDSEGLTQELNVTLDREGFLCSDISAISAYDYHEPSRYTETEKKEIPNTIPVEVDLSNWNVNLVTYHLLRTRCQNGEDLTPNEIDKYFGLRTYYKNDLSKEDYMASAFKVGGKEIKDNVRYYELEAKFNDNLISEDELYELDSMLSYKTEEQNKIIDAELTRTNEKLSELSKKYEDKIENLRRICSRFEEKVVLFGDKVIYLDFERFVHIFTRHVTETQVGDKYKEGSTVFQYKFKDIMRLISAVLEYAKDDIQAHFKSTPDEQYRRMGTRSIYYDGHYYRVEIDKDGSLMTFHPYNNNEEKDEDDKEIEKDTTVS